MNLDRMEQQLRGVRLGTHADVVTGVRLNYHNPPRSLSIDEQLALIDRVRRAEAALDRIWRKCPHENEDADGYCADCGCPPAGVELL